MSQSTLYLDIYKKDNLIKIYFDLLHPIFILTVWIEFTIFEHFWSTEVYGHLQFVQKLIIVPVAWKDFKNAKTIFWQKKINITMFFSLKMFSNKYWVSKLLVWRGPLSDLKRLLQWFQTELLLFVFVGAGVANNYEILSNFGPNSKITL